MSRLVARVARAAFGPLVLASTLSFGACDRSTGIGHANEFDAAFAAFLAADFSGQSLFSFVPAVQAVVEEDSLGLDGVFE